MTPLEMAMKLASSSSTCEKHKCPFMSKCKGDYTTCVMKEIALMLRSQAAEIDAQKSMIKAFQDVVLSLNTYIIEMEKINKRYHDIVLAFQRGYRPRKKITKPKRSPSQKKLKILMADPVQMDGNERYAYDPPRSNEPEHPLVVI